MRTALLTLLAVPLIGCTNDVNFSRQEDDIDHVSGNGELSMDPWEVALYGLVPEITTSETLTITNIGDNNLVIYEARIITSGGGTFYVPDEWQSEQHTVAPSQSIDLIVAATLAAEGTQTGSIRIKSNDVNVLERYVDLMATTDPEPVDTPTGGSDTGTTRDSGDPTGDSGDPTGDSGDPGTATGGTDSGTTGG